MEVCSVYNASLFGNCLTDLSITELLILQRSVKEATRMENHFENRYLKPENIECADSEEGKCDKPSSQALVAENRGYASSHPAPDPWQVEEKPSKLQTLFQISVTALSFLSFGGYLLCLMVQSIKSKGTTYFHPATTTMATTNGVKRIKVYRRSRRSSMPPIEATPNYNYNYNYNQPINPYQYYQDRIDNFNKK